MDNIINIFTYIAKGSTITLKIFLITIILSIPLGMTFALIKSSKYKVLKASVGFYTWIFRGTPLLLQIFFVYYGLPVLGIKFDEFTSASITFTLNYTAYFVEIFRAGIESIDKGQYEAAKVLGMNYRQTMMRIVLPQVIKNVLPPVCNEFINLIKDTALVTVIGMAEILRNAKEIVTREFTIVPFIVAGVIYLLITSIIVIVFNRLEKRYQVGR